MEDRKRTGFTIIIALVLMIALLYSFGLNLFSPRPQLELADPDKMDHSEPGATLPGEGSGGLLLEIAPSTVQSVIAAVSRYESYSRTLTISYTVGEKTVTVTVQVWEDSGWKRTQLTFPTGIEHSIVGDGQLWLWYGDGADDTNEEVFRGSVSEVSPDLFQRVPTYEDILALDPAQITDARYIEYNGQPCIYVEAEQQELGYLYRYWVSEVSGLLMAAETEKAGVLVYRMNSNEVISPFAGGDDTFVLPDGTVLF